MMQAHINKLEAFIKKYNPYFGTSFADVARNPYSNYIMSEDMPVFPDDSLGDYFYLRLGETTGFETDKQYILSEGVNPIGLKIPLVLVACVREADPQTLLENMISTLSQYLPDNIKLNKWIFHKEDVVVQELGKLKKELVIAALANLDENYSIVSVSFDFTIPFPFKQLSCLKFPAKCSS